MSYAGKKAPNSTSQMDSVAWSPKAPTLKPTMGGTYNSVGVKGGEGSRTSSSAAQDEKLIEKHPDAPTK